MNLATLCTAPCRLRIYSSKVSNFMYRQTAWNLPIKRLEKDMMWSFLYFSPCLHWRIKRWFGTSLKVSYILSQTLLKSRSGFDASLKTVANPKKSCILVWRRSISEIAPCKVTMWARGDPLSMVSLLCSTTHSSQCWASMWMVSDTVFSTHTVHRHSSECWASMWMVSDRTQTPHTPALLTARQTLQKKNRKKPKKQKGNKKEYLTVP